MATYQGASQSTNGISEEEVHAFLKRFADLYEKADDRFFDLFASDATVFNISSSRRLEGRDAFRKEFGPRFKPGYKRVSEILSPEVQSLGGSALVSYRNRIQVDDQQVELRASLVLSRDPQGGLQVKHLHNSALPGAQPAPAGRSVEEVVVLEERVATALSTIGTPK
jgi:ketosteroid isomerase-like protein